MLDLLELELTDTCEAPCGGWEQNLGSQEEQSVLCLLSHLSSLDVQILMWSCAFTSLCIVAAPS